MDPIIAMTAREVTDALGRGELAQAEVLDVLEARIEAVDGPVNALPTLCFDRARERAKGLAARPVAERGVLQGLPVPIKDLTEVAGVRSTQGSRIFAHHVPKVSDHVVQRIEARGGVVYAKSNTPEFGAGASTFNDVFGRTANPHDLSRSAAGSSGGAAAALASGMAWVAHGSDLGGSLRNPASFCGVVGLRPSLGLVPRGPSSDEFNTLSVEGPMARNIGDLGLLLDAMAGPFGQEPLSQPAGRYRAAAEAPRLPRRVGFSRDIGLPPVAPEVAAICAAAAERIAGAGVAVEEAHPDFDGAREAFQTLRALGFVSGLGQLYADSRDLLKPDVIWNIERGLDLTGADIARAVLLRSGIQARVARFFETFDLLLCPATIVAPFPVGDRTVTECDGVVFESYIDWLAIVSAITLSGCPALSIPCGTTADGLPIGLQIVAPVRGEERLLSFAAAIEAVLGMDLRPIDPRGHRPC